MKNKIIKGLLPFLMVVLIILFWLISSLIIDSEFVLPTPLKAISSFFELFKEKSFYVALGFTLLRSLIAFAFSFVIAFLLAFFSVRYENFKIFISPLLKIVRALPTIAVVLLLLFWTNSFIAPIIVTILVVLPILYTEIVSAFLSIDKDLIVAFNVFNISKKDMLKKVYIPQVKPQIFRSIGGGLSLNIKLMVASEVLSQTKKSLGLMLNTAKVYFETSKMIALVMVTVIIAVMIEKFFVYLSEKGGVI